ncbi:MAG TPA: DUF4320 family protein [Bacillota bacterium]|nr:DUF4320 family protein [Bacillota bacterium]
MKNSLRLTSILRNEKGSTYMELAIMMPLILFLVFGIIEAALVASADNSLVSVVDYGIRSMAVNGGMNENIQENIQRLLRQRGIDSERAVISATWNPIQFNDEIYLKIEYPYSFRLFGPVTDNLEFNLNLTADSYAISEKYFR